MHDEEGHPTHYVEDEYYDGAAIRASDYWSLKRLGRFLMRRELPDGHPLYENMAENMIKIDTLIPSRQVRSRPPLDLCFNMVTLNPRGRSSTTPGGAFARP